jgi:phosphatidylserine/phosphatidylglycerophosphate/cardiolipin synthase-like enzyme
VDFVDPARAIRARLVAGRGHYDTVIRAVMEAARSIWIATANLKELMVEDHRAAPGRARNPRRRPYRSVLSVFDDLAQRGVEIRILHAGPPSRAFREEMDRHPRLFQGGMELRHCPRLHFKAVVVDGAFLYLGSANWTGAGLGAKGAGRRNFELGFVTADDGLLDRVQLLYDQIWAGRECGACKMRELCPGPLDLPLRLVRPASAARSASRA